MPNEPIKLRFEKLLLNDRMMDDVTLRIEEGMICEILPQDTSEPMIRGVGLPGMVNAHSHAFQRAMAGAAEWRSGCADSFWSWRDTMYRLATRVTPEHLRAIAAMLYVELLEGGFTHVAEFNYLHHEPDGHPYSDRPHLQRCLLDAALSVDMPITLAPVLYQYAGFGKKPLQDHQQRFYSDTGDYLALLDGLRGLTGPDQHVAVSFHSLRAVPMETIMLVAADVPEGTPIHIHISEQPKEVADCVEFYGQRPVALLADRLDLSSNWNLVHATHVDASEVQAMAASGARVVLCPATEANLGDGLFPLVEFVAAGGAFSIGTDSHVETSVAAELRLAEYGQRLVTGHRNVLSTDDVADTGLSLWRSAALAGRSATGARCGFLEEGARADIVVLDSQVMPRSQIVSRHIFGDRTATVDQVFVGGKRVVSGGRHRSAESVMNAYADAMEDLWGETAP